MGDPSEGNPPEGDPPEGDQGENADGGSSEQELGGDDIDGIASEHEQTEEPIADNGEGHKFRYKQEQCKHVPHETSGAARRLRGPAASSRCRYRCHRYSQEHSFKQ